MLDKNPILSLSLCKINISTLYILHKRKISFESIIYFHRDTLCLYEKKPARGILLQQTSSQGKIEPSIHALTCFDSNTPVLHHIAKSSQLFITRLYPSSFTLFFPNLDFALFTVSSGV